MTYELGTGCSECVNAGVVCEFERKWRLIGVWTLRRSGRRRGKPRKTQQRK